jgi:hypothetical protein
VSALIAAREWDVPELHLEPGRLDEVFRTLTQKSMRTEAPAPRIPENEGAPL